MLAAAVATDTWRQERALLWAGAVCVLVTAEAAQHARVEAQPRHKGVDDQALSGAGAVGAGAVGAGVAGGLTQQHVGFGGVIAVLERAVLQQVIPQAVRAVQSPDHGVGFLQQGSRVDRMDARAIFGAVVAAAEQAALAGGVAVTVRTGLGPAARLVAPATGGDAVLAVAGLADRRTWLGHARRLLARLVGAHDQRFRVDQRGQRIQVGIRGAHALVAGAVGRVGVRDFGLCDLNQHTNHFGGAFVRVAAAVELGGRRRRAAAQQLEHQLVERDFGLVMRAREANQLAVEPHSEVAGLTVEHDLFAVGGVGGGHSGGLSLLHSGNLLPVL